MNSWDINFYAIDQSRENCMDLFTIYEYTFFYSSFSFNDLWLFMVYIRFVLNPANQKNTCFNDIDFRVMQRFTENKRLRAIGMLPSWIVTKHCR
jgi:hypothetical protein